MNVEEIHKILKSQERANIYMEEEAKKYVDDQVSGFDIENKQLVSALSIVIYSAWKHGFIHGSQHAWKHTPNQTV